MSVPPIRTFATSASLAPWKIILKPAQMIAIVTTAIEIVTRIVLTLVMVVLILSKPCAAASLHCVAARTPASAAMTLRAREGGRIRMTGTLFIEEDVWEKFARQSAAGPSRWYRRLRLHSRRGLHSHGGNRW